MAKRITNTVITGNDKRLGLYFYYSPHFGHNIIRKSTSLTGIRVKNESAFKGFRESGNRMKEASPIASSLYKLIPAEIKQYSLYRVLTGEALKLLKSGMDAMTITEDLKRIHIDPLLQEPVKEHIRKERIRPEERDSGRGMADFTRYPEPGWNGSERTGRILRRRTLQKNGQHTEIQINSGLQEHQKTESSAGTKPVAVDQGKPIHTPHTTEEKIPELIYLCRLPECKKLKLWIRSSGFPGTAI